MKASEFCHFGQSYSSIWVVIMLFNKIHFGLQLEKLFTTVVALMFRNLLFRIYLLLTQSPTQLIMVQKPISKLCFLFHYACYSCVTGYVVITGLYHYYLFMSFSIYLENCNPTNKNLLEITRKN